MLLEPAGKVLAVSHVDAESDRFAARNVLAVRVND